jgi:hypothetical protein
MFRKVAIALVAASVFAAPVMAQTPAATGTKPAAAVPATTGTSVPTTTGTSVPTTTDKSAPSTTVKANKSKSDKHSRVIRHTRTVSHKPVMTVKHARHFNAAKSHKVAGTAHKVVSAKSATRSSVN